MQRRELFAIAIGSLVAFGACGWNPERPFERDAPPVKQAIAALDAGDATAAAETLQDYLSTGPCSDGKIGTPSIVRDRPNGAFDLGLSLFRIGESFGRRFGDEVSNDGGKPEDEPGHKERESEIDCAVRVVRAAASDAQLPADLRARAHYLEGNLDFLGSQYEDAVKAYDAAITLVPGNADAGDGGDTVGADAAWNRAIALRRIEDQKDAGQDSGQDGSNDGSSDGSSSPDGGKDDKKDAGQDSGNDGASNQPDGSDGGGPDGSEPDANPSPNDEDAATTPPPPSESQDDRMLDQLENAPTVQQEAAKKQAQKHHPRSGMEDK